MINPIIKKHKKKKIKLTKDNIRKKHIKSQ